MTIEELKARRKQLRFNQFSLAKAAKVSRWVVASFEAGYRELFLDEALRIEAALNKKEASLVTSARKQSKQSR